MNDFDVKASKQSTKMGLGFLLLAFGLRILFSFLAWAAARAFYRMCTRSATHKPRTHLPRLYISSAIAIQKSTGSDTLHISATQLVDKRPKPDRSPHAEARFWEQALYALLLRGKLAEEISGRKLARRLIAWCQGRCHRRRRPFSFHAPEFMSSRPSARRH